tara:strand:+ start:265 stop:450 length:186 start_codon:yes stop_codon:yes gene_type:complete
MVNNKPQSDINKKIFNRIYYLLNKQKYIKKNKYRYGMKRYTNTPYNGKINIDIGNFIVNFD